jgi:quercetin dioxygenase-like cupin family protein
MKRIPPGDLPYKVESVDIVAELPDLVVSEITLAPGQEVPWHIHSNVTDTFYGLSGCTSIRFGLNGEIQLNPGESMAVTAGTPHQVECSSGVSSRFLIVQGIGEYDFIPTRVPSGRTDK